MSQQNADYSSRARLIVTVALLLVALLIYYSSVDEWTSNAPSYGIYRLIPRIAPINLTGLEENEEETDFPEMIEETTLPPTTHAKLPHVRYQKRNITQHVDCKRALQNDKEYMKKLAENRISFEGSHPSMECSSLRKRIFPPKPLKPTGFGVAFARVVYKDYEFIEEEVRSLFHPENLFCFTLDSKSFLEFRGQMKQLATCFPNIFIAEKEFDINSDGRNINAAHYECLKILHQKPAWKYVILLQNYDMIIRTPYELVSLYKELGGANDIELTPCPDDRIPPLLRNNTARELKLFRNESLATERQLNAKMRFAKGAVQVSLARAAVTWMVEVINMTVLIDAFNSVGFGADEQLMESLQVSTELDMPGRFTHDCVEKHHIVDFVSRMSHWTFTSGEGCASNLTRHAICLLALEDLYSISKYPNIMVNKFMPAFDYAGIDCLHELIFNRTHLLPFNFDTTYYRQMVNVRYHKLRTSFPGSEPPVDCTPKGKLWHHYEYPN